tara:strand:+ start:153 stop:989 length:837 start_codon:yes stop_codon:yes gene_type:complete
MLDFINNNSPLIICDIGASPIDKTKFIDELFNETFSQIIGFEPNKKEYDKLKTKDPNKKFYNYAMGDGEDKILNICKAPGMSSFLKPNLNYLKKFHGFEEWAQIISEEKVNTKKLNELDEKIDFLKIDVQGYEYEVLINGLEKLNNVKVIQIETSPFPLYQGEKNSSEIMRLLENSGFMLHMFNKINTRIFKPMVLANNKTLGLNHIFQLDCVMVKNFEEINKFSEEDLTKLILIMFYSFKSYDFVDYLISMMDLKYGTNILDKYRLLNKNLKIIKKY